MKTYRKTATLVGSGFLFSNITFILGTIVLVEAVLGSPDYLSLISANRAQVVLGVLLSFANGLAYVGFRVVEFITQILADVSPLALLTLAENTNQTSAMQGLGALLLVGRFWAFQMLNLIFSFSALLLYFMLFRTRLIPAFISIWALIAAALVLSNTVLGWFSPDLGEALGMITGLPMLLNEVFLGIWLIVRGFSPSATAIEPARQLALEA